jgi:hypothetical protein
MQNEWNAFFWVITICSLADDINDLEEPAAFIFRAVIHWKWKQQIPLKYWHLSTNLYGITSRKVLILSTTAMRFSDLKLNIV